MPQQKTKHTHTVQKEYLKSFSIEKDSKYFLWRLDKKTGKKKRLTIDNVSVENYFYPQEVENWLANDIEGKGIRVLKKIIEEKLVSNLNSGEKELVVKWIIAQDLRTSEFRNEITQGIEQTAKLIFKTKILPEIATQSFKEFIDKDPIKNIQMGMLKKMQRHAPIISHKYHWGIIQNISNEPYYTSDHPVQRDNTYLKSMKKIMKKKYIGSGKGYLSKGVEFQLSLNPELKLVIMNLEPLNDMLREIWVAIKKNPQIYPSLWILFPHDKFRELRSEKLTAKYENVLYFNSMITGLSNRFIYSRDNNFTIAEDLLKKNPEYKDENRKRWDIS
ncbi:hypothetical protein LCGC14_1129140 [marine sediment metagenome]|uniref:DUF4238 domain-containing protein n=1 Tax=marine sediment metagenome TaxID=412755 RepID=A0A0F9M6G0_9ZZZZ|nr:DUF4238 domain-containing protein [archaeon]